ncbi:PREDICTED: glucuronoxylan 4-O-methyltransferase 2 [Tarenaya hassleriana]|uniref:glucuronoxylan 4-O-methyltransferase 2 n=1 Tax=Tarenaya hassleriana TaxID=28532 RepID=UPI00053C990B|nr:PREDICTED: glucuronoxylan 4-O-methyltransferase 2 [Tarenaya hassleriana]
MPPEVHQSCRPILNPIVRFSSPASPKNLKYIKAAKNRMTKFPVRKIIPLLIFVLSSLSVLRLLRISIKSPSSSSRAFSQMALQPTCSSSSPGCESDPKIKASESPSILTEKEFKLLSEVVTRRSPCNILIFGFAPQYLVLSSINTRGITVILEDGPAKTPTSTEVNPNNTRIYKVKYYHMEVKRAYKLLRHARDNPACSLDVDPLQASDCKLGLRDLPKEVYKIKWDVIVVDGPRGSELEAPGRMGTIYTAAVLARQESNNTTDVFVHDVHRTAEKWFSWEFLCQENLVSTKGNFWRFRINTQSNTSSFCSPETLLIKY